MNQAAGAINPTFNNALAAGYGYGSSQYNSGAGLNYYGG